MNKTKSINDKTKKSRILGPLEGTFESVCSTMTTMFCEMCQVLSDSLVST